MRLVVRGAALGSWVFLLAGLVAAPLLMGSTRAWAWPITALLFVVAGLFTAVRFGLGREAGRVPMAAPACLALLVAFGALQATPLPRAVVAALSPERARQDAAALEGLAAASSVITISAAPDLTTAWAWKWGAGAIALTVAALALRRRREARFLMLALALLAGAEALFGVIAYFSGRALPGQIPGRAAGTFINPNHFAGLCELGFFVALGVFFDRIRRMRVPAYAKLSARLSAVTDAPDFWKAGLLGGLVLVIAMGLVTAMSRGAVLAAAGGFVIFTLLYVRDRARWMVVPALVLIVAFAMWAGTAPLESRLDRMFDEQHAFGRPTFWRIALNVFGRHPVVGAGLGAFAHSQVPHWPADEGSHYALFAHNDYLDTLSGGGLLGALLLVGFFAAIGWVVVRRMGRGASPLFMGAFAGVGALMAHAVVDFNWQIPGVGIWFFALCGVLLAPCFRRTPVASGAKAASVALAGVAVAGVLALSSAAVEGWHAPAGSITPAADLGARARQERLFGKDPTRTIVESLVREPMPGGAHVERGLWAESRGDRGLADECMKRAVRRDPGNIAVASEAQRYWLRRMDASKPDAELFAQLERVSGPVLWNSPDANGVLRQLLQATGSVDFLLRLVPPDGNPSQQHWERFIREFVEGVK